MKIIYFLLLMLMSFGGFCQESDTIYKASPERFKLYYYLPIAFGDNMLSKAHTNDNNGFGLSLTLFRVNELHINIALQHVTYSVSNISLAGNSETSYLSDFLLEGMYKIPITKRIAVNPKVAVGAVTIRQSGNGQDFGRQKGVSYNIGAELDYKLTGRLRVFAGVGYSHMRFSVNTIPEFESFYNQTHMVNLTIGLKV